MTKLILTTLAAAGLAVPAFAATSLDFTFEGHRIVGTVDLKGSTEFYARVGDLVSDMRGGVSSPLV